MSAQTETGLINAIGLHMTPDTAAPARPNKGNNMDMASAGFITIGTEARGDDMYLDEDSVTLPWETEDVNVDPPVSDGVEDHLSTKVKTADWEFILWNTPFSIWSYDSNKTVDASELSIVNQLTNVVKRTVILEVTGLYIDYFPRCKVNIVEAAAGINQQSGLAKHKVIIKPEKGSAGFDWKRYYYPSPSTS